MQRLWRIARIASIIVIVLAVADTILEPARGRGPYQGLNDFFDVFRYYLGQLQFLFAVGFFMASGFLIMAGRRPLGWLLFAIGVFFALRAGFTQSP